jgi:hypothetical protein
LCLPYRGRVVEDEKPHWSLPDRLRNAHRRGDSVAAILRVEQACGRMWLTRHLLEAFDFEIDLAAALAVVDALCRHVDSRTDAQLEAALPAKFGTRRTP